MTPQELTPEQEFDELLKRSKLKGAHVEKRDVRSSAVSRNGFEDFVLVLEYEEEEPT